MNNNFNSIAFLRSSAGKGAHGHGAPGGHGATTHTGRRTGHHPRLAVAEATSSREVSAS